MSKGPSWSPSNQTSNSNEQEVTDPRQAIVRATCPKVKLEFKFFSNHARDNFLKPGPRCCSKRVGDGDSGGLVGLSQAELVSWGARPVLSLATVMIHHGDLNQLYPNKTKP